MPFVELGGAVVVGVDSSECLPGMVDDHRVETEPVAAVVVVGKAADLEGRTVFVAFAAASWLADVAVVVVAVAWHVAGAVAWHRHAAAVGAVAELVAAVGKVGAGAAAVAAHRLSPVHAAAVAAAVGVGRMVPRDTRYWADCRAGRGTLVLGRHELAAWRLDS